ncbi:MAG: hypothetical protein ABIG92_02410 [Candidatus Omnitrophota bacterium]
MNYEFNILYYINMFKRWQAKITKAVVVGIVLTMFFLMSQPTSYISTVTLLSAGGTGVSAGPLGQILGISSIGGESPFAVIDSIIKSRRMIEDINKQFELNKKRKFRYKIDTSSGMSTFAIHVKGTNPGLTEKIANFIVENLDKINSELDVTPQKPMAKVLDPAVYGMKQPKQSVKKIMLSAMVAFLIVSMYAFFSDFLEKLKAQHKTVDK